MPTTGLEFHVISSSAGPSHIGDEPRIRLGNGSANSEVGQFLLSALECCYEPARLQPPTGPRFLRVFRVPKTNGKLFTAQRLSSQFPSAATGRCRTRYLKPIHCLLELPTFSIDQRINSRLNLHLHFDQFVERHRLYRFHN